MRQGHRVIATCDIKAPRGETIKTGSQGVIVEASTWRSTFTVTFIRLGWGGSRTTTVREVKAEWIRRA